MRTNFIMMITFALLLLAGQVNAQNKLVINDRARFLDTETEELLGKRLYADSITLTSLIDNKKRCDYWFAALVIDKDELLLSVTDCNDKLAGTRNLGSLVVKATGQEKATLLYFALSDIIKNPYREADTKKVKVQPVLIEAEIDSMPDPQHHSSRYFFAPSSRNLKKDEIYYNTLYFIVHDVQFGLTDQFSIGMGTTIFGFPFYLTPKISIPVDDRNSFALGDLLMIGTWGSRFTGNLLYGTYTRGDFNNNITVGGGYLFLGGGDVDDKINAAVINFSGLVRMSPHMFFITENYMSPFSLRNTATYNSYNPSNGQFNVYSESFRRNVFFMYGSTGFRFINKRKDLRSWQFGLSYFLSAYEKVPATYSGSNWYIERRNTRALNAFPVVGFARKFSTK